LRLEPDVMTAPSANVQAVRRFFEATSEYLSGNPEPLEDAVRELCAPDVVAVPASALASGDTGPFRGQQTVLGAVAAITERWSNFDIMADQYVDVPPNTVVLLGTVRAKRGDGSGYAVEVGIVNRFEDGLIASIHSYESKRRALEEAGACELAARARPGEQA